jgi:hypothetical protein
MKNLSKTMLDSPAYHNKENDQNLANVSQTFRITTYRKHHQTICPQPQDCKDSEKMEELENFLMDPESRQSYSLEHKQLQRDFDFCCESGIGANWLEDYSQFLTKKLKQ